MDKLFSEAVSVDAHRSVSVTEFPDGSLSIRGNIVCRDGDISSGALRLSSEASLVLRDILNRWHKSGGEDETEMFKV